MDALMQQLPALAGTLMWPFFRLAAALFAAPVLGEAMIPVRARALIALALAVVAQPALPPMPAIDPISVAGIALMAQQIVIGGLLGFSFHLVLSGFMVLGALVSAQMGLSMAALTDPVNGASSDAVSSLLNVLFILLFFAMDGHLLLTQVLVRSFHIWPVGGAGIAAASLQRFASGTGWVFAAAIMMALPVVFTIMVVQLGMGFLQRVAPALNLFSLGFAVYTLFGLWLLLLLVPAIPEHFRRMLTHVLDLLDAMAAAGGATP